MTPARCSLCVRRRSARPRRVPGEPAGPAADRPGPRPNLRKGRLRCGNSPERRHRRWTRRLPTHTGCRYRAASGTAPLLPPQGSAAQGGRSRRCFRGRRHPARGACLGRGRQLPPEHRPGRRRSPAAENNPGLTVRTWNCPSETVSLPRLTSIWAVPAGTFGTRNRSWRGATSKIGAAKVVPSEP